MFQHQKMPRASNWIVALPQAPIDTVDLQKHIFICKKLILGLLGILPSSELTWRRGDDRNVNPKFPWPTKKRPLDQQTTRRNTTVSGAGQTSCAFGAGLTKTTWPSTSTRLSTTLNRWPQSDKWHDHLSLISTLLWPFSNQLTVLTATRLLDILLFKSLFLSSQGPVPFFFFRINRASSDAWLATVLASSNFYLSLNCLPI